MEVNVAVRLIAGWLATYGVKSHWLISTSQLVGKYFGIPVMFPLITASLVTCGGCSFSSFVPKAAAQGSALIFPH